MIPSHTGRTPVLLWTSRAVLLAALLAPGALRAQQPPPGELSLSESLQLARENNPAFLQQRNDAEVARSTLRSSIGGLLPSASASTSFGYTAPGQLRFQSRVFGEEPETYFSAYNLGISYQLDGNTLLQPKVRRSELRATEQRISGSEAVLVSQVTQQYLSVLQAREQVTQAQREISRAQEYVKLAEARLEVGAGTPLDVRRAEVQLGRAEIALVQARNQSATAALVLGQLLGVSVNPDVQLTSEFQVFSPRWEEEELLDMAARDNPVLRATRAGADAAVTTVDAARSSYLPSLGFNLGWRGYVNQYGSIDPLVRGQLADLARAYPACTEQNQIRTAVGLTPHPCTNPADPAVEAELRELFREQNDGFPFDYINQPWQASVTVSLPIFTGFTRQLQIDRARAAAADARYEVRAEELRLRQEVGSAIRNLRATYETVQLQQRVQENAAEELRLAQERFRFGAASSVEVTDAQTNLAQAEREQIDAVYNFHKALATLEALVGRPLREP